MAKGVRESILKILVEPATVTQLKEQIKEVKSFGTLAYHLKELQREHIITKNEKKEKGEPITYQLQNKDTIKKYKQWKIEEEESKKKILKKIKEKPYITYEELYSFIETSGDEELSIDDIFGCSNDKLSEVCFKITPKGLKYLGKN